MKHSRKNVGCSRKNVHVNMKYRQQKRMGHREDTSSARAVHTFPLTRKHLKTARKKNHQGLLHNSENNTFSNMTTGRKDSVGTEESISF